MSVLLKRMDPTMAESAKHPIPAVSLIACGNRFELVCAVEDGRSSYSPNRLVNVDVRAGEPIRRLWRSE